MRISKIMTFALSLSLLSAGAVFAAPAKKAAKAKPVTITVIEMTGNANGSQDEGLNEGLKQFIGGEVEIVKVDREAALKDPKYKDVLDYIHSVGCDYYFEYIPLKRLGLPVPPELITD